MRPGRRVDARGAPDDGAGSSAPGQSRSRGVADEEQEGRRRPIGAWKSTAEDGGLIRALGGYYVTMITILLIIIVLLLLSGGGWGWSRRRRV